jgi:hypothetical protein
MPTATYQVLNTTTSVAVVVDSTGTSYNIQPKGLFLMSLTAGVYATTVTALGVNNVISMANTF